MSNLLVPRLTYQAAKLLRCGGATYRAPPLGIRLLYAPSTLQLRTIRSSLPSSIDS